MDVHTGNDLKRIDPPKESGLRQLKIPVARRRAARSYARFHKFVRSP